MSAVTPSSTPTPARQAPQLEAFLAELRREGFKGGIHKDLASRLLNATDNSIYQLLPELVLCPLDTDDINTLFCTSADPAHVGTRFCPRGGGTGTNGQALTNHVTVDTSRHTNKILGIDPSENWVEVEPGVVLGQLNAALAPLGQFFPPTTSTASRVTIGGMVSTDACGKGSRVYGRTGDYIESLQLHLPDGREITCRRYSASELEGTSEDPSIQLAQAVRKTLAPHSQQIRHQFPDLYRGLTGYNLNDALGLDGSIDLTRLVAGAEGTLGLVSRIKLKTRPLPAHKAVVVVRYSDFDEALRDAQWLLESGPTAVETLDERIRDLARHDPLWETVANAMTGPSDKSRVMCNLVEIVADDFENLEAQIAHLSARLTARGSGHSLVRQPNEMAALWNIRSRAVGMLGRIKGNRKPVAFVEDTAVPPASLADYIAEFRQLLERYDVSYAMYGHVDVGCLHVRPALDMSNHKDQQRLRAISDEVVSLVRRYQGLIWGEHGKGFRGEYTQEFFGDKLYSVLGQIKGLFDPGNRMNPGKIVAPTDRSEPLHRIDEVPLRGQFDAQIPRETRANWHSAMACNGNGVCFDWDTANVLCPSYKATGDRIQSPKGRATLLREWIRQQATEGRTPEETPVRVLKLSREKQPDGIEHALHEAMAGCLGCKACATQCPVHVNIPSVRSRFLDIYYRTYRRPLRDHVVAETEGMAPWMSKLQPLVKHSINSSAGRQLCQWLGLVDLPIPARQSGLRKSRDHNHHVSRQWAEAYEKLASVAKPVAVIPDAFTAYYETQTLPAVCELIAATGSTPVILPFKPSGKALHAHGFMNRHQRASRRLLAKLSPLAEADIPIVAVEPSVGLFLRDDCQGLMSYRIPIQLLSEWVVDQAKGLNSQKADDSPYTLFIHCTEQTYQNDSASQAWVAAFAAAGATLQIRKTGCCGMAGAYGHQSEQLQNSVTLFDASWRPAIESANPQRILATGYSCRTQISRFAEIQARHPAVALAELLGHRDS
jgi:FAD/FMN-containing dehydrogenase/Fe-S oxidoreductase